MKIELGDKVMDVITGYEGIAIARTEYLTGCDHIGIQSQAGKDSASIPTDWQWFDVRRIKRVKQAAVKLQSEDDPGGPQPLAPSR